MNRSAINAEVEYRLRMQERERAPAPHHHEVPAKERKQPGLLARALASLKTKPRVQWERPGRPSVELK
jgi:hypothetical protein